MQGEGSPCVRFYRRFDGTVLTADCPVGLRKLRFRRAAIAGIGIGILAAASAWFSYAQRPVMGVAVGQMAPRGSGR